LTSENSYAIDFKISRAKTDTSRRKMFLDKVVGRHYLEATWRDV